MHRSVARRVVVLALASSALALPAVAQPSPEQGVYPDRIISSFWERLGAPVVSLWEKVGSGLDPLGAPTTSAPTPPPPTDGRGMIDPDG